MSDEHDEIIERVAASLRPLPSVDPSARARVLVAVAAAREEVRERSARPRRRPAPRLWAGAALLTAAAVTALLLDVRAADRVPAVVEHGSAEGWTSVVQPSAILAARGASAMPTAVPVQLVFRAPAARRVTVVGDFTGWDPRRVPLSRDSATGVWSVNVTMRPGRHVYAFVVDDTLWTRDPRAPIAADADFGRPGSLLLVGRP